MTTDAAIASKNDPTTTARAGERFSALSLDDRTIEAYEKLDKWKERVVDCPDNDDENDDDDRKLPSRLVYGHNRSRAAATGFPTRLTTGSTLGLTEHETSAVFGWTTGDYRLINPIARGADIVEFDEYPFLPNERTKVRCRLRREDVSPYIDVLSTAISKLPALSSTQRLWRGHRRKLLSHPSITTPGSVVTMRGFASVTRDREKALEFAAKPNEGRSAKRTLIGILEHSSGKCVSKLSARPGEMEVLFPLDRKFEVVAPPEDTADDDLRAVRMATERMRKTVDGAEIDLVYVRELV